MTRGIDNNNPGNIRLSDVKFQGEIDGQDPDFKTFESAHFGIRAIARILLTYYNNHHLNTIAQIISRWAPGTENNTQAYIDDVAHRCVTDAGAIIDVTDERVLDRLVTSIIFHENGEVPYNSDIICSAVDSALGG